MVTCFTGKGSATLTLYLNLRIDFNRDDRNSYYKIAKRYWGG